VTALCFIGVNIPKYRTFREQIYMCPYSSVNY
jgi:hypothetical protein